MAKDKEKKNRENCGCENCGCDDNTKCDTENCAEDNAVNGANVEPESSEETSADSAASDLKDKFLRLAADFENFKKRSRAEREGVYTLAVADTVEKILPVIDDMERAYAATSDESSKKGIEQVIAKFASILTNLGVTPIGEVGEMFDVNLHEAIMQGQSDEYEDGAVLDVFQKGYKIGNKVIRYAKVKVNNQ